MSDLAAIDYATLQEAYRRFKDAPAGAGGAILDLVTDLEQFLDSVDVEEILDNAKPVVEKALATEALRRFIKRMWREERAEADQAGTDNLSMAVNAARQSVQLLVPDSTIEITTYVREDDHLSINGLVGSRKIEVKTSLDGEVLNLVFLAPHDGEQDSDQ